MVDIHITSMETIRPASSTPEGLRNFKLSLFDMQAPASYLPILLFYSSSKGEKAQNDAKSHQLKTSLSEALTHFFPLAGRMKEESLIDCNDQGVEFLEAQVSCELSDFFKLPNMVEFLYELLPCKYFNSKSGVEVLLAIQVNHFQCDGIAIGVSISHLVADIPAMATFIDNWAAIARGADHVPGPCFNSASLFPAERIDKVIVRTNTETLTTRRFVFTGSSIASLRAKSSSYSLVGRPSRLEAVSALIWGCITRATGREGQSRALVCQHAVNIRSRMDPPLPDNSFGNLFVLVTTSGVVEKDLYQGCLEKQLREAFTQIDSAYVRELQRPNGYMKISESRTTLAEKFSDMDIDLCTFSSWGRLPWYEFDFGWGKPVWVSTAPFLLRNVVILIDRRWGDGVEAWVNLEEVDMARLVQDEELLSFVSNPDIV